MDKSKPRLQEDKDRAARSMKNTIGTWHGMVTKNDLTKMKGLKYTGEKTQVNRIRGG